MNACASLTKPTVSRRAFVTGSMTMACYVSFPGAAPALSALPDARSKKVNVWVTFKDGGVVEVTVPGVEIGTGAMTAIACYVAEELDASWSDIHIVQAPDDFKTYGNPHFFGWQISAGVRTVLGYYDTLRLAGAQARYLMLTAAASRWKVPLNELTTADSAVHHAATKRQLRYADLLANVVVPIKFPDFVDLDFQLQPPDVFFGKAPQSPVMPDKSRPNALPLKRRSEFRLIGYNQPRFDIPDKSRGLARYGIDGHIDGMLYAMVLVAPRIDGLPGPVDDKAARAIPGIIDIITLPYGVAVVGTDFFAVRAARELVKVTWLDPKDTSAQPTHSGSAPQQPYPPYDSAATLEEFAGIAREHRPSSRIWTKGNADQSDAIFSDKRNSDVTIHSFEARSELVYHAPIEPQNAIVQVTADKKSAEVWVGTQMPMVEAYAVCEILHIPMESVKVNAIQTGGAFGRRAEAGAVIDAAYLAARRGKPVKVIWTREDDLRRNPHRMAIASRMDAAVDRNGKIVATRHTVVADSFMARTQPDFFKSFGNNDPNNWSGAIHTYDAVHQTIHSNVERRAVNVCYFRGICVPSIKFCQETLVDRIALERGIDTLEFRLANLEAEPRAQAVLREVAKLSDWSKKREKTQLGIAYADYTNSHVAIVTELSLDQSSGDVKVHKIFCAIDVGMPVQPEGIITQSEGGILMMLSIALKEQITVKDSVMQEKNFGDYNIIRMAETPDIIIKVIPTDNPIAGAGELAMYPVAASINCALARITGKHLNKIPMLPEDILKIKSRDIKTDNEKTVN